MFLNTVKRNNLTKILTNLTPDKKKNKTKQKNKKKTKNKKQKKL